MSNRLKGTVELHLETGDRSRTKPVSVICDSVYQGESNLLTPKCLKFQCLKNHQLRKKLYLTKFQSDDPYLSTDLKTRLCHVENLRMRVSVTCHPALRNLQLSDHLPKIEVARRANRDEQSCSSLNEACILRLNNLLNYSPVLGGAFFRFVFFGCFVGEGFA